MSSFTKNLKLTINKIKLSLVILLSSICIYFSNAQTDSSSLLLYKELLEMDFEDLLNIQVSTAGKTAQSVSDIPASVVVITRSDIEDLLSDIPGFYSLGNAFFYGGTNFGVRGFSSPGAFTNVMILVNGVNQMEDFSNGFSTDKITVPISAIDRVEIVRGPMAVVYGSNAFMGVINIITNETSENEEIKNSRLEIAGGTLGTYEGLARLAGQEGDGIVSYIDVPDATSITKFSHVVDYQSTATIDQLQLIPRLAAIYSLNDNNVLKLMFSQSKKRPTFVELDNAFSVNSPSLSFANMSTFELNYTKTIANKFCLNTSVYYNSLSDLVVRAVSASADGSTQVSSTNKGEARTLGAEICAKAQLFSGFKTELNLSYQKTSDKTQGLDTIDYSFSPSILGYFKASYSVRNILTFGLKTRYVGEMYSDWNVSTNTRYSDNAPSYVLVDLNVSANIYKGIYTNILVSNILNSEVRYASNQNSAWTDKGMIGYGRRFQVTLGYEF